MLGERVWKQSRGCMWLQSEFQTRLCPRSLLTVSGKTHFPRWKMLFTTTNHTQGNCTEPKAPFTTYFEVTDKCLDTTKITFTGTPKFSQITMYYPSAACWYWMIFRYYSWDNSKCRTACMVSIVWVKICVLYMWVYTCLYKTPWEDYMKKTVNSGCLHGKKLSGDYWR